MCSETNVLILLLGPLILCACKQEYYGAIHYSNYWTERRAILQQLNIYVSVCILLLNTDIRSWSAIYVY